ncbi:response regulator [Xylophilus ampelinus]|uniref:Response regulator receiver domain-containing protein n=1 Tax=Xylophilus ampelinus TaxID=54067 RepID=A0A318SHZ0_9BURK|nr:response regulator [Xylophilus ampelinus]MCS4511447.1 response regulator [Xylophilus ampelinus]PYE74855.1 response regulator receiver domain-containing protein [Xylophilus ampelinus]
MALRLYLIEDDEAMRSTLAELLSGHLDIEVVGYGDNELSVTHWLSSHDSGWDLAIVDLQLRTGSGIGALQWCATRMPHQKVVVLSGMATDEARARCLALGADGVFDKATEMDAFVAFCCNLKVGGAAAR